MPRLFDLMDLERDVADQRYFDVAFAVNHGTNAPQFIEKRVKETQRLRRDSHVAPRGRARIPSVIPNLDG